MSVRFKPLRRAVAIALIVYWSALFVGTHLPGPLHVVQANDKLLHLIAYAGLSFLCAGVFAGNWPRPRILLSAFAVIAIYGGLDELLQLPIPGRHGDPWDWLADVIGAALGLVVYLLVWAVLHPLFSPELATAQEPSLTSARSE